MLAKIRALAAACREQTAYLVAGGATTVLNYILFTLLTYGAGIYYVASNIAAWAVAVIFSYFANGKWVYRSTSRRSLTEALSFVLTRLFSLGLETLSLFLLVSPLRMDKLTAKLLVAVLVVIVNYLTGLLIFTHK